MRRLSSVALGFAAACACAAALVFAAAAEKVNRGR